MKLNPIFPTRKEMYFGWRYLAFQVLILPYLLLFFRVGGGTMNARNIPWVICLIISMITFLGLVIFRGRDLRCELEKRLHL